MSGVDIEGVLADHRPADPRGMAGTVRRWFWVCTCGDCGHGEHGHTAHVAAVLREQIAAAQAEAWDEGFRTACGDQGIVYDIGLRPPNPYRAAQLAPARVPSEEG